MHQLNHYRIQATRDHMHCEGDAQGPQRRWILISRGKMHVCTHVYLNRVSSRRGPSFLQVPPRRCCCAWCHSSLQGPLACVSYPSFTCLGRTGCPRLLTLSKLAHDCTLHIKNQTHMHVGLQKTKRARVQHFVAHISNFCKVPSSCGRPVKCNSPTTSHSLAKL